MYKAIYFVDTLVARFHLGKKGLDGLTDATFKDYSGNANHVKARGTQYYPLFDGVDDIITVTQHSSINSMFDDATHTIGAWFLPLSGGENNIGAIVAKESIGATIGWYLRGRTSSNEYFIRFYYYWSGGAVYWTNDNGINLYEWHRIIIKYNDSLTSNVPTIYINGVQIDITQVGTPSGSADEETTQNLLIGDTSIGTSCFDGGISDVFLYKGELTDAQILADYNKGLNGISDSTFAGRWKMNESDYGSGVANSGSGGVGAGTVSNATATQGMLDYAT